jgi:hypothetical protein
MSAKSAAEFLALYRPVFYIADTSPIFNVRQEPFNFKLFIILFISCRRFINVVTVILHRQQSDNCSKIQKENAKFTSAASVF